MKTYLVFTTDIRPARLNGENPRLAERTEFAELDAAKEYAEKQKEDWDLVSVFYIPQEGTLEKIEEYLEGQKYVGGQRSSF